jgi:hypothetical protein
VRFHRRQPGSSLDRQNKNSYEWVIELAENKLTELPNLEEVEFDELSGRQVEWEYPEDC